jgi:uncharacterized protein
MMQDDEEWIMAGDEERVVGSVASLWRYPVKSMLGEELNASDVTERGLLGDRAYALVDTETGKVVSAKDPRKWGKMFDFRAAFVEPPRDPRLLPPVRITSPDGDPWTTDRADIDQRLSEGVGRPVRLTASAPEGASIDGYWPDLDWLADRDQTFEVPLPPGTFFDAAVIHLVTTATLDRLRKFAPRGRFETRRFRPNLVVEAAEGAEGFVEDAWVGRALRLGDDVLIRITEPCPRCVMTTLPQGDLPKDPSILRATVEHNGGNVGVLAWVIQGGRVRRGDAVALED